MELVSKELIDLNKWLIDYIKKIDLQNTIKKREKELSDKENKIDATLETVQGNPDISTYPWLEKMLDRIKKIDLQKEFTKLLNN